MMINESKVWYDVTEPAMRPEAAEPGWYGAEQCWNCDPEKSAEAPARHRLPLRRPAILRARKRETGRVIG